MCARQQTNEETIYYEAVLKPPKERKEYIRAACGDDTALLARIEALLEAREVKDGFLKPPTLDPNVDLDDSLISESPGTIIDRYKLLERIGEG
ncbi:MAG: serine/threonine protein kinase, partial [Planctomycetota bacterium]